MNKKTINKNSINSIFTKSNIFFFCCFLAVSIILIIPLWNESQIFGHDAWYHITRIEALKVQILDGNPFSRINYFFNQGLGYASSLCYPDLLLYIPALFRIMGLDINVSYNIFLGLIGLACFFTTFYCVKKMTKNTFSASIAATLFTLCNYHLDCVLTRGAVGEIQAFIFIPFVIYGLYNFLYEDFSKPHIMAIGFIGLVLSHTITTFLVILLYIIILLINSPKFIKNYKLIIRLAVTAGVVLLCTCYYWIPLLELMTQMDLAVSHPTRQVPDAAVSLKHLFADVKMADGKVIGIGISVFMLLIFRLILKTTDLQNNKNQSNSKNLNLLKIGDTFAIAGTVIAFCATEIFPWELFEKTPLNSIQFPWRLFIVASILLSFAAGAYLTIVITKHIKKQALAISVIIAGLICILGYAHTQTIEPSYKHRSPTYFTDTTNYSDGFDGTVRTGGAEWMPYVVKSNKKVAFTQCNIVKDQIGKSYNYDKQGTTVTVKLDNTLSDIKTIQVPLIYYIGYDAKFTDTDGNVTKLDVSGVKNCGLCVVEIPENTKGTLTVYYKGTLLQKISLALTIITILSLIGFVIYKKKFKKEIIE